MGEIPIFWIFIKFENETINPDFKIRDKYDGYIIFSTNFAIFSKKIERLHRTNLMVNGKNWGSVGIKGGTISLKFAQIIIIKHLSVN